MELIGKNIIGFKFDRPEFNFQFCEKFTGKLGTILRQRSDYVIASFECGGTAIYPLPEALDYIVKNNNKANYVLNKFPDITKGIKCLVWDNDFKTKQVGYVHGTIRNKFITYSCGELKLWDNIEIL